MAIPGWEMCPEGCGWQHKAGDANPVHDAAWLARERVRLRGALERIGVTYAQFGIGEMCGNCSTLLDDCQDALDDDVSDGHVCAGAIARAALAPPPVDQRGPGVIGSHWIHPSPAAAARPRNAVTSGAPPALEKTTKCTACGAELGGHPMTPPVFCGTCATSPSDEVAAARARRTVPRLEDRAGPAGVTVDVGLEPPPPTPPYRGPRR